MRFVATERASEDARLGKDVFGGRGGTVPLLRAGVVLESRYRRALVDAGITRVLVSDAESDGISVTSPLSESRRLDAATRLVPLLELTQNLLARGERFSYDAVATASEVASLVAHEVLESRDDVISFDDGFGPDGYPVQHPIDVTVLGLLIARKLFAENGRAAAGGVRTTLGLDDSLRRLSLGLILHDLGVTGASDGMRLVDGSLEEDPWEVLHAHTQTGHDALPWSLVSAHASATVRHHHEHWDGTGPQGLAGEQIPQFARIAAVADTYDALTSARAGHAPEPSHAAVEAIARASGTLFDPEVVEVFLTIVAPFPPGTEVTLSDGSAGVVTEVAPAALHRPFVRLLRDPAGARREPLEVAVGGGHPGLTIVSAA